MSPCSTSLMAATVRSRPSRSPSVWTASVRPRPTNRSSILPTPYVCETRCLDLVDDGRAVRWHGEVLPVIGPDEAADFADEGAGDDPADPVVVADGAGDAAHSVELGHVGHAVVGGDLEHRVARRVEDEGAGFEVLGPELVDDDGAGGGVVADELVPGFGLESLDQFGREPGVGERGMRILGDEAGDLPVTGCRVLAAGRFAHPADRHRRVLNRRHAENGGVQVAEAGCLEVGQAQPANRFRYVADRVGSDVSVFRRIGRLTDAARIHDNDDCSAYIHGPTLGLREGCSLGSLRHTAHRPQPTVSGAFGLGGRSAVGGSLRRRSRR